MGLKALFTIPEGEKITEKALRRVLISSICSILLCMACLVSTTWAWFTVSIENTGNIIEIGTDWTEPSEEATTASVEETTEEVTTESGEESGEEPSEDAATNPGENFDEEAVTESAGEATTEVTEDPVEDTTAPETEPSAGE